MVWWAELGAEFAGSGIEDVQYGAMEAQVCKWHRAVASVQFSLGRDGGNPLQLWWPST